MKNKLIRASAKAASEPLQFTASVNIQASTDATSPIPTFDMVAYTGGLMRIKGFDLPLVVALDGIEGIDRKRPALRDHDFGRVVGHTTRVAVENGQLVAEGSVSGAGVDAAEVRQAAINGFPWQASIGATPISRRKVREGETVTVNGQVFNGPIYVIGRSRLGEISFVSLGADENTSARIAASSRQELPMFEQWLKARGFDDVNTLSDAQRTSLEAMFNLESAGTADKSATQTQVSSDLDEIMEAKRLKADRAKRITAMADLAMDEHPELIETIGALSHQAMEGDWPADKFELTLLRKTRGTPNAIIRPSRETAVSGDVLEAAICLTGGLEKPENHFSEQVLEAASTNYRSGIGVREVLTLAAKQNGYRDINYRDVPALLKAAGQNPTIQAANFSTISLPNTFSNVMNKFSRAGFDSVEQGWRAIAAVRSVRDFKQITTISLTGDLTYIEVAPGGEIKHGTLGEKTYTNQAKTYGRMISITRQDIINDDLGALTQVPRKLGRGGAIKLNELVWSTFMNNGSFFTSGNANYLTGVTVGTNDSRLNIEGLTRAEAAFYNQTDPDGKPLGAIPEILVVPNALFATATQLMNSTEVRDTTANTNIGTANPHAGKFSIVRSSYLSNASYTGNSTTAWYILANPDSLPTVEVVFLNGQQMPTIESSDVEFSSLGIQTRAFHDMGAALQEFRAGVKSKGAA